MRNLVLFFLVGLSSVVAQSKMLPADSEIQKVSCYDPQTGELRYQLDRIQDHEDVRYSISTDIYNGVWTEHDATTMLLTEDRENAVYFMSGLTPKEDSLTYYKRTGSGHLILLNRYSAVVADLKLNCKITR